MRSCCVGIGGYVPSLALDNDSLARQYHLDTSDEWIRKRTGIASRHLVADNESTTDLAYYASLKAIESAGLQASDIDLIVLATTTPEHVFPATAARLQHRLQASKAFSFDVQAVCAGFVYALSVADQYIQTGHVKTALVVGADTMSRLVDWGDRSTCVLFGDGAGALVLQARDTKDKGVLSTHLFTDGSYYESLYVKPSVSEATPRGAVFMDGNKIFIQAVRRLREAVEVALNHHGYQPCDLDVLIPHQANQRILDSLAEHMNFPTTKVISTIERYANTSAASIPLAMAAAHQDGRLVIGSQQLVALAGIGGGLAWGSALMRM